MKTIKVIRLYFVNLKSKFRYGWRKHFTSQKYYGTAKDVLKKYRSEHPKASGRQARRHVERELRKLMKKDHELKSNPIN